jgi:hypothetical protein
VIEAYELESQVAKYPRILVTEDVRKAAWDYHKGRWKRRLFIQDNDGCWFVNVLTPSMSEWSAISDANADISSRKFLQTVRKWLSRELPKARRDLGRLSKLQWLGSHFNRMAAEKSGVDPLEFLARGDDRTAIRPD